jgi:hypothetical protein
MNYAHAAAEKNIRNVVVKFTSEDVNRIFASISVKAFFRQTLVLLTTQF